MPQFKNILTLFKKSDVLGTERIPVSKTEYITPEQIIFRSRIPCTRIKKEGGSGIKVSLAEPCSVLVQQQLYVGLFFKSRGRWRLACNVTENKFIDKNIIAPFGKRFPSSATKIDAYRQRFNVAPVKFDPKEPTNVMNLFRLEFMPMSELGAVYDVGESTRETDRSELLINTRQNSKLMHGVSRHNATKYVIKDEGNPTDLPITIDRTYRGAKQVVKRDYRIGLVRPRFFKKDGTPNWGGYYRGDLHDFTVVCRTTGRKQGVYENPQTELYFEMK